MFPAELQGPNEDNPKIAAQRFQREVQFLTRESHTHRTMTPLTRTLLKSLLLKNALQRVWFRVRIRKPSGDDASFGEDLGEDSGNRTGLVGVSHLTQNIFGTTVHIGNYHGGRLKMQDMERARWGRHCVFLQPLGTTASRISIYMPHSGTETSKLMTSRATSP
jgi:hypothetical protein